MVLPTPSALFKIPRRTIGRIDHFRPTPCESVIDFAMSGLSDVRRTPGVGFVRLSSNDFDGVAVRNSDHSVCGTIPQADDPFGILCRHRSSHHKRSRDDTSQAPSTKGCHHDSHPERVLKFSSRALRSGDLFSAPEGAILFERLLRTCPRATRNVLVCFRMPRTVLWICSV